MSKWPMVPLSKFVTPVSRPIAVEPGEQYRTIGVRWWGEGAYERQTIDGSQTAAKTLSLVKSGDLIINKIWVRHGSTAVATDAVNGCAASNEFPTFVIDRNQADPRWLHWLTKTKWFWQQCDVLSSGTSGKNRIKPEKFLTIEIPLPHPDRQNEMLTTIDAIAARIDEAKELQRLATIERDIFLHRIVLTVLEPKRWPTCSIAELLREDSRNGLGRRPNDKPPGVPILRISAGTSRTCATVEETDHKFLEVSDKELSAYRLEEGDLLACRFNGNLHYVGRFSLYRNETRQIQVYPDKLIRLRVDTKRVLAEFVALAMNSPFGRTQVESFCATTAGNIGISATALKTVQIPVPPLETQKSIILRHNEIQQRLMNASSVASAVSQELNALLPALLDQAYNGSA